MYRPERDASCWFDYTHMYKMVERDKFTRSNHNLLNILSFLSHLEIIQLQTLSKRFYNKLIPRALTQLDYSCVMNYFRIMKKNGSN